MINDFRRAMRRRNLRPATIAKRVAAVDRWLTFAGDRWASADREHLEAFLDGRRLAARSRYGEISHLHMFYRWALRERLVTFDPTELVERPRLPRRLPRPAAAGDVDVTLAGGIDEVAVAVSLMADAGLRCCEVAALRWGDVDLTGRRIYVTGKGGHDRTVGIPSRLLELLAGCDESRQG